MTLQNIFTMLNSIEGFVGRVAFDEFPASQNQSLPYINMQTPTTATFAADNITYFQSPNVNIELYTKRKDMQAEAAIEETLTNNGFYFSKYEGRIDGQSCYQVVYEIGA